MERASEYWDVEQSDDEAFICFSIRHLVMLSWVLELPLETLLFGAEPETSPSRVSFEQLAGLLRELARESDAALEQLSLRVGWDFEPYLTGSDSLWDINVVGLHDLATAVDVDWVAVLLWAEANHDA